VERVLTDETIRDRIAKLCIGLAAECDAPNVEPDVEKLLRSKLTKATTLPFVAFLTHDLQWVHGYSGGRNAATFAAELEKAEQSPLVYATPAVEKKLETLATKAEKDAAKSRWAGVLKSAAAADGLVGRSAVRERIVAQVDKARKWASAAFDDAIKRLAAGADRAKVRVSLKGVASAFAGHPEADTAKTGLKAIDRLTRLAKTDPAKQEALKAKYGAEFKDTPWAGLFLTGKTE
jgi:hypothetical protein